MGDTTDECIKNNCLALMVEATEVLNEVNWKPWRKTAKIIEEDLLHDEIADCFAFVINIAIAAGMTPQDLAAALYHKQNLNVRRFS